MAANSRSTSATWSQGALVKSAQFEVVESNAAGAVARASSTGGWKALPLAISPVGNFSLDDSGLVTVTDKDIPNRFLIPLIGLPCNHTLVSARMKVKPATGHTAQPANTPVLRLYERVASAGATTPTELSSVAAAWVNTASYESGLTLTCTPAAAATISATKHYYCVLITEHGANGIAGTEICSIEANVTVDTASGGADFTFWR